MIKQIRFFFCKIAQPIVGSDQAFSPKSFVFLADSRQKTGKEYFIPSVSYHSGSESKAQVIFRLADEREIIFVNFPF